MVNSYALKIMANKAKNRLLNKDLRNVYSNANILNNHSIKSNVNLTETNATNVDPKKYMLDVDKMIKMDADAREKYLLQNIYDRFNSNKLDF